MIRYIPQPCDTDPNELESLAYFHDSKGNHRTASILRAYAATLRQQAGRVDEGMDVRTEAKRLHAAYVAGLKPGCGVETSWDDLVPSAKLHWMEQATLRFQAALAQNTQGDWVLVPREPTPEMAATFGSMGTLGFRDCYTALLAAAPSQRAEVK